MDPGSILKTAVSASPDAEAPQPSTLDKNAQHIARTAYEKAFATNGDGVNFSGVKKLNPGETETPEAVNMSGERNGKNIFTDKKMMKQGLEEYGVPKMKTADEV